MKIILGALLIFCAALLMARLQAGGGSENQEGCTGLSVDKGTGRCAGANQIGEEDDKRNNCDNEDK